MTRFRSYIGLGFLLFVLAGFSMSANVRLEGGFNVEQEDMVLVVRWQTSVEENVKEYVLERRTPFTNNEFREVKTRFTAHGAGRPYTFRDEELYKSPSEQVEYKLYAISAGATPERTELASKQVNYTTTTVRRTWGSIKAMFQ